MRCRRIWFPAIIWESGIGNLVFSQGPTTSADGIPLLSSHPVANSSCNYWPFLWGSVCVMSGRTPRSLWRCSADAERIGKTNADCPEEISSFLVSEKPFWGTPALLRRSSAGIHLCRSPRYRWRPHHRAASALSTLGEADWKPAHRMVRLGMTSVGKQKSIVAKLAQ